MSPQKAYLITIIVQKKIGQRAIDAALKAGAYGATYFQAEGTGARQKMGPMGAFVDTGKQIVQIVANETRTDIVLKAVTEATKLNEPGQGFAYVQEVVRTVGLSVGD